MVSVDFTASDADGRVIDQTPPEEPLRFLFGAGNLLSGLERQLAGAKLGQRLRIAVPPEEAYGLRDGEPQAVPRDVFPADIELVVGYKFMARSDDGHPFPLWVTALEEKTVYVDANHPLAGQTLYFDVKVVAIRPATDDELQTGYAHNGCAACRP